MHESDEKSCKIYGDRSCEVKEILNTAMFLFYLFLLINWPSSSCICFIAMYGGCCWLQDVWKIPLYVWGLASQKFCSSFNQRHIQTKFIYFTVLIYDSHENRNVKHSRRYEFAYILCRDCWENTREAKRETFNSLAKQQNCENKNLKLHSVMVLCSIE